MIRKTLFLFLLFLGFGLSAAAEDSERVNHQAVRVVKELTPHWTGTWALDRHMGDRHADASEGFHAL